MPYITDDDSKAVEKDSRNRAAVARDKIGIGPMVGSGQHAEQRQ